MKNKEKNETLLQRGSDSLMAQLDHKGDLKFRFAALQYKNVLANRDYGNGQEIKMLDAHILKEIDDHPGIVSVELAQNWCRARSAMSVIVQRLEDEGYIIKGTMKGNKKERALFTTEKGKEMCRLHRRYDAQRTSLMLNDLLKECTPEEIESYFKVLEWQIIAIQRGYVEGKTEGPIFTYSGDRDNSENEQRSGKQVVSDV